MKRGRILTVLLAALIVSSIVMTFRLWFTEKLWPEGDNFFSIRQTFSIFGEQESSAPRHGELYLPARIVVNCIGSRRSIYTAGSGEFQEIYDLVKPWMSAWIKQPPQAERITAQEYYATLKGRSLLLQFPVQMPVNVLGQLMQVNAAQSAVSSLTELVLQASEQGLELLAEDHSDGAVYRYVLKEDGAELAELIDRFATGNSNRTLSAFELGFYRRPDQANEPVPKLVLQPFVMLDTSNESRQTQILEARMPTIDPDHPSQTDELLRLFDCNPNTVNRYTDQADARVFVSDRATLRLYPGGLLEYTATNEKYGISLTENGETGGTDAKGFLQLVDATTDKLAEIFRVTGLEELPQMRVSSDIPTEGYRDFSYSVEYQYNGTPVAVNVSGGLLSDPLHHGATMEIHNGRITSMRVLLRNYGDTGKQETNLPLMRALDLFSGEMENTYEAKDVSLCFIDTGADEAVRACWSVMLADGTAVRINEE